MKVYIYGLGKGKQTLDRCLIRDDIEIIAYIDRYKAKKAELHEGIPVIDMKEISDGYDKIIITLMQYEDVKADLCAMGIDVEKIICFYSLEDVDDSGNWRYIDLHKWRNELLWKNYTEVIMPSAANYPYEIYSEKLLLEKALPTIVSAKETVEMIRKEKKSLSRFGDNEFELILGRERTNYQTAKQELGVRLEQVLKSQNDRILVAVADNYGSLEKYTGQFTVDGNGYLVDAGGNFVYGFRPDDVEKPTAFDGDLVPIKAPSSDTGSDFDGDALQLSGIKINSLGEITGTILAPGEAYDGKTVSLGKVAIATFQNPQGLSKKGGYYYGASTGDNSGAVSATIPGGSAAELMTGYLEGSNVDLAKEFADMITTQRGFQANSKIITVSDEILSDLINMKR